MKQVSIWAKNHVLAARLLLASAHLLLSIWAVYAGFWLNAVGVELPDHLATIGISLFALAALAYPVRSKSGILFIKTYAQRKSLDAIVVASGLVLLAFSAQCFSNYCAQAVEAPPQAKSVSLRRLSPSEEFRINAKPASRISKVKQLWQTAKTAVRDHAAALKQAKLKWWQVGLVALSIVAAVFLLVLTLLLSCDLGCNGNQALAAVVFLGGIALTLALYVLVLRAIFKRTDNMKQGIIGGLIALVATIATLLIIK